MWHVLFPVFLVMACATGEAADSSRTRMETGREMSMATTQHVGDLGVRSLRKRFNLSGLLPQLCDQLFVRVRSDDFGELFAVAVD